MPIISHVDTLMKFIAAIIKVKFLETVINNLCLQQNVQLCFLYFFSCLCNYRLISGMRKVETMKMKMHTETKS